MNVGADEAAFLFCLTPFLDLRGLLLLLLSPLLPLFSFLLQHDEFSLRNISEKKLCDEWSCDY